MKSLKRDRRQYVLPACFLLFSVLLVAQSANAASTDVFQFTQWASVAPASGWTFVAGNFTGTGRSDILGYQPSNGTVWVGRNTGSGFDWGPGPWTSVTPAAGWTFISGNFTGGALDDILGYNSSASGTVWVGRNTGAGFNWESWTSVSPTSGWTFVSGNFTGSGRADILGYQPGNGTVWVGRNTGTGFDWGTGPWTSVTPTSGWTFAAGKFSGGTLDDIMGYCSPGNGTLWMAKNTGASFDWNLWSEQPIFSPNNTWNILAGTFAGDGSADLLGYQPDTGNLSLIRNAKSLFYYVPKPWATVTPSSAWSFVAGKFTSSGRTEVMSYNNTGTIWVGRNTGLRPEGYVWPLSAAPGQRIEFHISGVGSSTATFFRHSTNSSGSVTNTQTGTATFPAPTTRGIPDLAWANGCNWPVSFAFTIPANWTSGIYSARLTSTTGAYSYITFFVKPNPSQRSNIAVLASVNKYLAYNNYGGRRKYDGAANASFLRPDPFAEPIGETFEQHAAERADLWILGWLERNGFRYDLYTDLDLHNGIPLVQNGAPTYRKLVMLTHPEYWTTKQYSNLQEFQTASGSLLYLGGNGIYEIAAYRTDQMGMTFLNGVENGNRDPALFRNNNLPEINLLGVAYLNSGVLDTPYTVTDASSPVFTRTGLRNNDQIGTSGLNTGGTNVQGYSLSLAGTAAGWEVDTTTSIPGVLPPPGSTVVARASNIGGGAEMIFRPQQPGRGSIFSVGSITFGGSLAVDLNLQRIVRNVLNLP